MKFKDVPRANGFNGDCKRRSIHGDAMLIGEALCKHLSSIGELSAEDRAAILKIEGEVRQLQKGRDILTAGDVPHSSVIVMKGLLCRHSWKRDGTRQIHGFYIPTDAPSLETLHIDYMDHNLGAVVASAIGMVPHAELFRLMEQRPKVLSLIWRESLVQAATFREWLMRNSTLPADAALAHLFCEIYVRSKSAGLVADKSCEMPVTQELLGHALGLTAVHINRTMQLLRDTGLVEHKNGRLYVEDFHRLAELGEFDPQYLHLRNARTSARPSVALPTQLAVG